MVAVWMPFAVVMCWNGLLFVAIAEERGGFAEDGWTAIDIVPIFTMFCQTALEIVEVLLLRVRPQHFRQCGHSGHHHVFHMFWG